MPVTLRGVTTASTGASTVLLTYTINNPSWTGSTTPAGDVVLLWVTLRGAIALATPSGFTAIPATVISSGQYQLFYRVTDGSEGATFTISWASGGNTSSAMARSYSGADTVLVMDPAVPSSSAITGLAAASITTVRDGDVLVWFAATKTSTAGQTPGTITPPSGFTGSTPSAPTTTVADPNVQAYGADEVQATHGATGTLTGTDSTPAVDTSGGSVVVALASPAMMPALALPALGPGWLPGLPGLPGGTPFFVPPAGASPVLAATIQGVATLAGTGSIDTSAVVQGAGATLAGTGSIDTGAAQGSGGTLGGAGSINAPITQGAIATLAGTGSLNTPAVIQGAGAALAGAGSLATAAIQSVTATLPGAGSLTAPAVQGVTATLSGTGSVSANGGGANSASLAGSGSLAAPAAVQGAGSALAGAGSLTAPATQLAGVALAGTGSVSTAATQGAAAVLAAVGSLVASGGANIAGAATMTGAGSINAPPSVLLSAATLAGAGSLTTLPPLTLPAATLAGLGSLTALATQRAGAALAGLGVLTATGASRSPVIPGTGVSIVTDPREGASSVADPRESTRSVADSREGRPSVARTVTMTVDDQAGNPVNDQGGGRILSELGVAPVASSAAVTNPRRGSASVR